LWNGRATEPGRRLGRPRLQAAQQGLECAAESIESILTWSAKRPVTKAVRINAREGAPRRAGARPSGGPRLWRRWGV